MIKFELNNKPVEIDAQGDMPLLWALRDLLNMTGTKFGCGIAQCGACTVHMDGQPIRSCVMPLSAIAGKKITTIEGLSAAADHPIQKAWYEHGVPQCGYCQSGQMMSAAALLANNTNPTDEDIDVAMQGNICRCGTYPRIKAAIKTAAKQYSHQSDSATSEPDWSLVKNVGEKA
ncbi:(2Fe-2S)-binding protein [Agaribacter flavus]|uniref:(2Fe-2S)-binding protein n=1 Tax=Agaribacter flavus TaxID=1902781 RepID=A0ABV7FTL1_9ALTE